MPYTRSREVEAQTQTQQLHGYRYLARHMLDAASQQVRSVALPFYTWITNRVFGAKLTFEQNFINHLRQSGDAVVDTSNGYITFELKKINDRTVLGIVDEEGKVEICLEPWETKLSQYLKNVANKITYVEYGELHDTWSEADFAEFREELAAKTLLSHNDVSIDFNDTEIHKHVQFDGDDKDLKLDLYLKWVNRYGRPEDDSTEEESSALWNTSKMVVITGLMLGAGIASAKRVVTWAQGTSLHVLDFYREHVNFDMSNVALGVLGTMATSNPLWLGLSMLNSQHGAYGQVVNGKILNQTVGIGQQLNLTINMRDVFGELASDISITQADGKPLREWLSVNVEPMLKGSCSTPGEAYGVATQESGKVYMVGHMSSTDYLLVISTSNATNPFISGTQNFPYRSFPYNYAVAVSNSIFFITGYGVNSGTYGGWYTSNGVACTYAGYSPRGVAMHGTTAYVAGLPSGGGLHIVGGGSWSTSNDVYGVAISGTMAYVIENGDWSGLRMVNVSDVNNPVLQTSFVIPSSRNPYGIAISGTTAYVSVSGDWAGLQIIDISNVTNLVLKSNFDIPNNITPYHVAIDGTTLYMAVNGEWSGLQIIDISSWRIAGTPQCQDIGKIYVKVTSLNNSTMTLSDIFTIDVEAGLPTIGLSLASQSGCCTVGIGELYNFTFAHESFSNMYNSSMIYAATKGNGDPLPNWLTFNPKTRTFTGTVPGNLGYIGPLTVKVTATTCDPLSVSQNFVINVTGSLSATNIEQAINYFFNTLYNLADIVVTTPSPTVNVCLTIHNTTLGEFIPETKGSVTSTYDTDSGAWRANGSIGDINALLADLRFKPSPNAYGNFTIGVNITDSYEQNLISLISASGTGDHDIPANNAALIGGIIGGIVTIGLIGTTIIGIWRCRKHQKDQKILYELRNPLLKQPVVEVALEDTSGIPEIKNKDLKLGRELGRGGFGTVYKGLWDVGNTEVAVKKLNPGLDALAGTIADFEREAAIMAKLRHPNIVQIYGICRDDVTSSYCIVMEFMGGGALDSLLYNRERDLPWQPTRWQIIKNCAVGLRYLHDQNVMHRDIKSGNVLLDVNLQAKWTDFGISRVTSESRKTMTRGQGTVSWMAPEIMRGDRDYTNKADVYSFGILLWEMVAREEPYKDVVNQFQLYERVLTGRRPTIPPEAPLRFAALMQRCWAQRAEERPDMETVKTEIDHIIEEEVHTDSASSSSTSLAS